MHAENYEAFAEIKENFGPDGITPEMERQIRSRSRETMIRNWKTWLEGPGHGGGELLRAIRSHVKEWMVGRIGLSFHATQMLTGHGCFGQYLRRIGSECTERCWHCDAEKDTARHTLRYFPAWEEQRAALRREIGQDITMPTIVRKLLQNQAREAFLTFCSTVMRSKENSERAREGIPARETGLGADGR